MQLYFADNLRFLMKRERITQEQMADFLGRKRSAIGSYIRSESEPPLSGILLIAENFGISTDDLLSRNIETDGTTPERQKESLEMRVLRLEEDVSTLKQADDS